jgi:hypothetical protein
LPTSLAVGVPVSWPVVLLKLVHFGAFVTLKVSDALLGLVTVGRNAYCCSALMTAVGVPLIDRVWAVVSGLESPPHALSRVAATRSEASDSEWTTRTFFIVQILGRQRLAG